MSSTPTSQSNPTDPNDQATRPVVLVATDCAATGEVAVREGVRAALRQQADLHVVTIIDAGSSETSAGDLRWLDSQMDTVPNKLRDHVGSVLWTECPVQQEVVLHVRLGRAAEAILQASVDVKADLLVVGSARRRGVERLFLGSVAQEVLRLAHCPVLVALKKDYAGLEASPSPAPAMTEQEKQLHAKFGGPRRQVHVYEPNTEFGSSSMSKPTGMRIV